MQRFQDYNLKVGELPRGQKNAITDVAGVRVGHCTKIEGDEVRTGVTVIDPGIENLYQQKIPAAVVVGNGYGKLAGSTQIEELGMLEAPIALTNTLAVGPVMRGVIDIVLERTPDMGPLDSINVVVGECNDGLLNEIHRDTVTKDDVRNAFIALTNETQIGSVGAGTGTRVFGFKGGIGTASRLITFVSPPARGGVRGGGRKQGEGDQSYILGILIQTNFGGHLTLLGKPIWQNLQAPDPPRCNLGAEMQSRCRDASGSCMIVLATDAPLTARQLKRIASRVFLGLGRTGSVMSHSSGDYAVAFTTSRQGLEGSGEIGLCLKDSDLNDFFEAAVDATEEAVYDALFAAETITGRAGTILEALPKDQFLPLLQISTARSYTA